jgi:hypothetical protein
MNNFNRIIAKEIIFFTIVACLSTFIYFGCILYNSVLEKKIVQLSEQLTTTNAQVQNFVMLSNYLVKEGWFKSKVEFLTYAKDTNFQRDFYEAEKNEYLKSCKDLKDFKAKFYLDSIGSLQQIYSLENNLNIQIGIEKNEIEKTKRKIIPSGQIQFYVLILLIMFYPIRLFIQALLWAIRTIRKPKI